MVTCTRHGCGQEFDPDDVSSSNSGTACTFHPGNPIFHEGLKSWSCCKEVNKPVLDFDEFMAIKGCVVGSHSSDPSTVLPNLPKPAATADKPTMVSQNGTEVYGALPPPPKIVSELKVEPKAEPPPAQEIVIEEDPVDVKVDKGMKCKRKPCGKAYEGEERKDDECRFHPGVPIFHEGSKGYSCCKRKVLEFDEFLKIEGCRRGKHLFVGQPKEESELDELITLRTDHYQTPNQVIVSVFGKGADKEKSKIEFTEEQMHIQLFLPNNKKYVKSFNLFGPIVPDKCSWKIMSTKAEIVLQKEDLRSWPALDNGTFANSPFVPNLTFGVGGKRGTFGAKEMVLPETF
ncbi:chord-domain-containing protein [Atractiella rhizophila]|nr:chord-domain-containing protein [Atractiella rhizophila]